MTFHWKYAAALWTTASASPSSGATGTPPPMELRGSDNSPEDGFPGWQVIRDFASRMGAVTRRTREAGTRTPRDRRLPGRGRIISPLKARDLRIARRIRMGKAIVAVHRKTRRDPLRSSSAAPHIRPADGLRPGFRRITIFTGVVPRAPCRRAKAHTVRASSGHAVTLRKETTDGTSPLGPATRDTDQAPPDLPGPQLAAPGRYRLMPAQAR